MAALLLLVGSQRSRSGTTSAPSDFGVATDPAQFGLVETPA